MPDTRARAGPLIAAGILSSLASRFLARADQNLFGLPSNFLAGFLSAIGIAVFIAGLALIAKARHDRLK